MVSVINFCFSSVLPVHSCHCFSIFLSRVVLHAGFSCYLKRGEAGDWEQFSREPQVSGLSRKENLFLFPSLGFALLLLESPLIKSLSEIHCGLPE